MLGRVLLDTVAQLLKDILDALRDAIKQKDIFYFFALIIFIISFTAGMIFAFGMLIVLLTLLTNVIKNAISTLTVVGFLGIKGGSKNENQNLEKRRKAERKRS